MKRAIVLIALLEAPLQILNAIPQCQRGEVRNENGIAFDGIQPMVECHPHHKV